MLCSHAACTRKTAQHETPTCARCSCLLFQVVHAQHSAVCPVLPASGRLVPLSVTSLGTRCAPHLLLKYLEEMDGPRRGARPRQPHRQPAPTVTTSAVPRSGPFLNAFNDFITLPVARVGFRPCLLYTPLVACGTCVTKFSSVDGWSKGLLAFALCGIWHTCATRSC